MGHELFVDKNPIPLGKSSNLIYRSFKKLFFVQGVSKKLFDV